MFKACISKAIVLHYLSTFSVHQWNWCKATMLVVEADRDFCC